MWVAPSGSAICSARAVALCVAVGSPRSAAIAATAVSAVASQTGWPSSAASRRASSAAGIAMSQFGQAHGQDRLRRQETRQTTKPPFRPGVLQRDGAELQTVVEGADDHAGRAQVPCGLRASHAAQAGVTQAGGHRGRVGVGVGVGVDRDRPRVGSGGRTGSIGGIHDQPPSVGTGARPPGARRGDPKQAVVQIAVAFRTGLLGDGDEVGHP
jgi:hypothetical protein